MNWSSAETVNVSGLPAVVTAGAMTAKCVAAVGATPMAALVPLMVLLTVSVAVRSWYARGFQSDAEAADAVGERGIRGQAGLAVAASEMDRASIVGIYDTSEILGRHRHVDGHTRGIADAALTMKWSSTGPATAMTALPLMLLVRLSVTVTV